MSARFQRCHNVINMCLSLPDINTFNLQAGNYRWSFVNGMLLADKNLYSVPADFLSKCECKASCPRNCGCQRGGLICTEYCKCQSCKKL